MSPFKDPLAHHNVPAMPNPEEVEAQKELLNLKPALDFVRDHRNVFRSHVEKFFAQPEYPESRAFVEGIPMDDYDGTLAQISIEDIKNIIAHVPLHLVKKSALVNVAFSLQDKLPVPAFDASGKLDRPKISIMTAKDFVTSHHHPSRVLIGITSSDSYVDDAGETVHFSTIRPSNIPETVSKNPESVYFYQLYVFLHEFFHTIETSRSTPETASSWMINKATRRTFADWKVDYAKACEEERTPSSFYANVYTEEIFGAPDGTVDPYSFPMREWMCEDFAGAMLGILPNAQGKTDFFSSPMVPLSSIKQGSAEALRAARSMGQSRRSMLIKELLTPEYTPDASERSIRALQAFEKTFGTPHHVCYPACGVDVAPLRAFSKESHVTFLDSDESSIRKLTTYEQSPRATMILAQAQEFQPTQDYDLIISKGSAYGENLVHTLRLGGHVLQERTYSNWIFDDNRLKLVGVILHTDPSIVLTDSASLRTYGEAHPSWSRGDEEYIQRSATSWGNNRLVPADWYIFEKVNE